MSNLSRVKHNLNTVKMNSYKKRYSFDRQNVNLQKIYLHFNKL